MCGIAGLVHLKGERVDPTILQEMTDSLIHRGPDGGGVLARGAIGMGHRRLAILDLTDAAAQPMREGDYAITFNGEIYNYQELQKELTQLGFHFTTRSDTEVVLKSCIAWGEKAVLRFNGMFAFAFWDRRKNSILLARDRYGIKPLYYTTVANQFLFASESKAFLKHPHFTVDMDPEALLEYMTFQNFFTDRTLFKGVKILPAGTTLLIEEGEVGRPRRYWDFHFQEEGTRKSDAEYEEELDHLFTQSVKRQLVADVEISAYLSGGMDSASITAIAARSHPYIKSFTVGFDLASAQGIEIAFDERRAAEALSAFCKTEHYEMVLKAGDMERVMPLLSWHLEEPRVGQCYPNFYAAKLAGKFGKVVLAGTGGDELFAGYPWRYYRAVNVKNFQDYIDKYYHFWQRLVPEELLPSVLKPLWSSCGGVSPRDIFQSVFGAHQTVPKTATDYVNHSLYFEAKTFLHGLLVVEDKMSMASGLETRVPFLDNDLVDFAMKLPLDLKLGKMQEVAALNENDPGNKVAAYYSKTNDGKLLLRRVMKRYIPPHVTELEKQGFSAPDASWFKGESIEYVKRVIWGDSPLFDYLDQKAVTALVEDHLSGRCNRRLLIWSLLNLDQWCKNFLGSTKNMYQK